MRKYFSLVILTLSLCLTLAGCATTITRENLLQSLHDDPAPLVVDVRSLGEYDKDHLPGAVHIPFYSVISGLKKLGYPKQRPIVVYCEHGPRAGIAGMSLYLSGYDRVYSLQGHMQGWRANGYPLATMPP